jgi:hypothetical protein
MRSFVLAIAFLMSTISPAADAACEAAEFHQFDFWLGEWEVTGGVAGPNLGKVVGQSSIAAIGTGCGLSEHWRGATGVDGRSLNAYDAVHKTWRQFWVGNDGTVLQLAGGLKEHAMVLEGELPMSKGGVQKQRITWTPRDDGSVTQHWETSDDNGATWATSFLGVYRKKAAG